MVVAAVIVLSTPAAAVLRLRDNLSRDRADLQACESLSNLMHLRWLLQKSEVRDPDALIMHALAPLVESEFTFTFEDAQYGQY